MSETITTTESGRRLWAGTLLDCDHSTIPVLAANNTSAGPVLLEVVTYSHASDTRLIADTYRVFINGVARHGGFAHHLDASGLSELDARRFLGVELPPCGVSDPYAARRVGDGRYVSDCGFPVNPAGYCCEHGTWVGPDGWTTWDEHAADMMEAHAQYRSEVRHLPEDQRPSFDVWLAEDYCDDGIDRATCPEHGEQVVIDYGATRGPDPYGIQFLACRHAVVSFGPEETYIVETVRS